METQPTPTILNQKSLGFKMDLSPIVQNMRGSPPAIQFRAVKVEDGEKTKSTGFDKIGVDEEKIAEVVKRLQSTGKNVKIVILKGSNPKYESAKSPAKPPGVRRENEDQVVRYVCNMCSASFNSKVDISRHVKTHIGGSESFTASLKNSGGNECPVKAVVKNCEGDLKMISETPPLKHLQCKICKVHKNSSTLLYKHYKEAHDIDNPYLRKSDGPRGMEKETCLNSEGNDSLQKQRLRCADCDLEFASNQTLSRHQKNTHSQDSSGICHHCGTSFRLNNLASHEKKCATRAIPRRRQDCVAPGCKSSFYKKEELIKHMKDDHKMQLEPMRTLRFSNEEEFKKWKLEEEDRTFSYYSKHAGTKRNIKTYYCQHEGTDKSHRSSKETKEKSRQNRKGRIKNGNVCTSYLRAKITDKEVIAYYYPTHSHPISPEDLKHQPLSKEILKFIKEQIALNVPARQIQVLAKKKLSELPSSRRDAQVSLKRITSMMQRYRRQQNSSENIPNIAADSFNSFIDVLSSQNDSPVLFYQPPSENAPLDQPNDESHLFFLGLQTADQRKMLLRETAMPMFISVTKADYTLQYYLISIVVPCENNFEYPVGHLISSQMNEEVITLFLQTIGEKCPEMNVNCIVSYDCPEINSAIRTVFGNDGPYFVSKWHFLEFMRKEFLKTLPTIKAEEIFDVIVAMADAESEDRFLFLHNTFKEEYQSKFADIVSNFDEYFVRSSSWASCYRQGTGVVDSCLYADSFFYKLNKRFRRRPTKSLTLLPDLLLYLQESYRNERESRDSQTIVDEVIREQHNLALDIQTELVQEIHCRHWTVQATKHGQSFHVMQCLLKCCTITCSLKCKDCSNLCSHMYFCTCGRTETICLHVHKVHQQNAPLQDIDMDVDCADNISLEEEHPLSKDTCDSPQACDSGDLLVEAEAARTNVLQNLDALRQVVEQRCVPEDMVNVIKDTLESLVNLVGNS